MCSDTYQGIILESIIQCRADSPEQAREKIRKTVWAAMGSDAGLLILEGSVFPTQQRDPDGDVYYKAPNRRDGDSAGGAR